MAIAKENIDRETILAVAAKVFSETSFEQASIDIIAVRLGSSKAKIYCYFESKEALFIELIHRSTCSQPSTMMDILRKSGGVCVGTHDSELFDLQGQSNLKTSLRETLIIFGENVLNSFHTPQSLALQRMVIAATINSDVGYMFYEHGPAKAIEYVRKILSAQMEAGVLRKTDARIAACHYYGLLQSEIYQAGIFNVVTSIQPRISKIIATRAVDVFLSGYAQINLTRSIN